MKKMLKYLALVAALIAFVYATNYEIYGQIAYIRYTIDHRENCACQISFATRDKYYDHGIHKTTCHICSAGIFLMHSNINVTAFCKTGYGAPNIVIGLRVMGDYKSYHPDPWYGKYYIRQLKPDNRAKGNM